MALGGAASVPSALLPGPEAYTSKGGGWISGTAQAHCEGCIAGAPGRLVRILSWKWAWLSVARHVWSSTLLYGLEACNDKAEGLTADLEGEGQAVRGALLDRKERDLWKPVKLQSWRFRV